MPNKNFRLITRARKKNPYNGDRKTEAKCWKIISHLTTHKIATSTELAAVLKTSDKNVRKYIQHIRENNHRFFNPSKTFYIIATSKGYELTRTEFKLKNYEIKLKIALESKGKQLREIQIAQNLNEHKGAN